MTQAARTADSMWTRLGRMLAGSAPVVWLNDSVLHHPHITRGRGMAHEGWSRVLDVCYPLIVLLRGTRRGAAQIGAWWKDAPKEKRRLQTVISLACLIGIGLLKFGPLLLILGFIGAAAWLGRDTSRKGADPESPGHISRLQAIYNGLVPYLQNGDDPDQHFKPGGGYRDAFTAWEFDERDRLIRLRMDYSEYFRDGEVDSRAKVERALEGKIGHANEYLYAWDEEGNHLDVRILPPLPEGIGAQPWPVADIEFVLGVTDPGSAGRLIPMLVADPEAGEDTLTPQAAAREEVPPGFKVAQLAPVIWRLGTPSANPHLLLTGGPGTGKSTAVRSLLGQALARGHRIAVIDTDQTAEYGALAGRPNVLRITEEPADSLDLLDWFGLEIERRAEQARGTGSAADAESVAAPDSESQSKNAVQSKSAGESGNEACSAGGVELGRESASGTERGPAAEPPLWLFVDDLPELCAAAGRLGRPDPQDTLAVLARKARFARTTLVVTARVDQIAALRPALRNQLTSRIALGKVDPATSTLLFGGTLELGGAELMPQGRGYARIGTGPVIRLQTPYAPALALSAA
jgi:hypothetical protein